MHHSEDDPNHLTEADRTSETRFGPRPVPEGHRPPGSHPLRALKASRRAAARGPSLSAKIIVWGGVGLGVAGVTAGTLMAARKIVGIPESDRPRSGRATIRDDARLAPRFSALDEDEREAIRRRTREQARQDRAESARLRAEAARDRNPPRRRNAAEELTRTASELSSGLEGVAQSLLTAFQAFRGVAAQASGIVAEFAAAADAVREAVRGNPPPAQQDEASMPRRPDDSRQHRL
ncbi:MAG: hypothetical protein ACU0FT_00360 [Paracoccus sp. (in: a-proteobacteria)]|uniref:hypothetical protein n=1 Tax=Paracoccus sp. TaxID=267 RepID=UPI0040583868